MLAIQRMGESVVSHSNFSMYGKDKIISIGKI